MQRWIWEAKWTELRGVQERAIPAILAEDEDVILAAATAGGKTEAAFLPIVTALLNRKSVSVGCLYVGPLKALINDQYGRMELMCRDLGLPVWKWHGDVSAAQKQRVFKNPSGILMITPESLEAIMVLRGLAAKRLVKDLRFVVVDELHSFVGPERGRQLQSLLQRVEQLRGGRVPRIGLSATLGDMGLATQFLRPRQPERVQLIVDTGGDAQELRMQHLGFLDPRVPEGQEADTGAPPPGTGRSPASGGALEGMCAHMFAKLRGHDNLVFANSKSTVERVADRLRTMSEQARVPNEFLPHHGSLSKSLREDVEAQLKRTDVPLTAVCTSTLEMGIDIGTVESIAEIGPPPSVASLRQRLGRSGRRGGPAVLRMYLVEREIDPHVRLSDVLRIQTFQAVAMTELLLDRWCESPDQGAFHYSTLVQQVLSVVAQHGGQTALQLWKTLCEQGAFPEVDQGRFALLLRHLGKQDIVAQMGDGQITVGLRGERLVSHYQFYTAFTTTDEYRIVHGASLIGQMPLNGPVEVGVNIIFGGRRWRIVQIDEDARLLGVVPSSSGMTVRFDGGGAPVADEVRRRMRQTYATIDVPPYLDSMARRFLAEGRSEFARLGLASQSWVVDGSDVYLFPWVGDRAMATLMLLLVNNGLAAGCDGAAICVESASRDQVRVCLEKLAIRGTPDTVAVALQAKGLAEGKFDYLVPPELRAEDAAARQLDGQGAYRAMQRLLGRGVEA